MRKSLTGLLLLAPLSGCATPINDGLRIDWRKGERDILTIRSDRLPGGKIETWYLEAFCRRGSTDRDWSQTTIPFESQLVAADPDGRWVKLRHIVDGKVVIDHEIRAGYDEVDIHMTITNQSNEFVDLDWAQPCVRVGDFTGRGQDDYFQKCFIFTDQGLTRMDQTHRETKARYTPGQVYVPGGVDLNDVNPRPLSRTRPVNGLVGCFSADEKMILAMAWDHVQELFQGIIVCIHSDVRIGGLKPRQTKIRHGKYYIIPNDVPTLLARYERDFGGK
ncbi:MAG TPA: hypothetical protein PLL20_11655 [Phycisphaerae bacterium]|nr:hypothetical protein [Phycisphaerae bacterium]HRR84259.1 hypothetical protein [Phycisphaerae bacterium]